MAIGEKAKSRKWSRGTAQFGKEHTRCKTALKEVGLVITDMHTEQGSYLAQAYTPDSADSKNAEIGEHATEKNSVKNTPFFVKNVVSAVSQSSTTDDLDPLLQELEAAKQGKTFYTRKEVINSIAPTSQLQSWQSNPRIRPVTWL